MSIFAPSTFVEGQGLIDDVDVTIKEARIVNWDYNGSVPVPVPALKLSMEVDGLEGEQEQYWSMGKGTDWQPNEDGTQLVAVGKSTGITSSSNMGIFMTSLVNAGFPENKITDDIRFLEGLKAHMVRVPAPKRGGTTPKAPRADGRVFEQTILTVGTILQQPGEKAKAKPATGKPSVAGTTVKAAPVATAATSDDVDERCSEVLMEILSENPDGVAKAKIPGLAMPKIKADVNKNKIITRLFQEDFLNSGAWDYTNGKVSLG